MTRLNLALNGPERAINFAQGFPDFQTDSRILEAAAAALRDGYNQYATTWGAPQLRSAVARKQSAAWGRDVDPDAEVTVSCGATEAMIAAMLTAVNPGDEVVIFEPFYENYGPDTKLCGAVPRFVRLRPPDWSFDPDELRRAFSPRTKAIILNSPNNPTGKVFSRSELELVAGLCQEFDALAITDEIYEHITYDGERHVPIMTLDGMRHRSVLVNSMSKTFSVTGWRVGWVLAAPDLCHSIRKVHDFLTVGAAAPLQEASAIALTLTDDYYHQLTEDYVKRRSMALRILDDAGFRYYSPRGAYYVITDISGFGFTDDVSFVRHLIQNIGVAAVPGSSFYNHPADGAQQIRFCFCKKYETLELAGKKLLSLAHSR
jgi:aspartate/methionine/tyrosine aminotransferase